MTTANAPNTHSRVEGSKTPVSRHKDVVVSEARSVSCTGPHEVKQRGNPGHITPNTQHALEEMQRMRPMGQACIPAPCLRNRCSGTRILKLWVMTPNPSTLPGNAPGIKLGLAKCEVSREIAAPASNPKRPATFQESGLERHRVLCSQKVPEFLGPKGLPSPSLAHAVSHPHWAQGKFPDMSCCTPSHRETLAPLNVTDIPALPILAAGH